eukprot:TRINITY_DN976_c0_g1_i2.p1 TRINITY_DN976_c0_g1~~TRINITY_DN976_c0_g1_i2.p1  ORF type:complete len:125 (+),score=21.88 TRINITY_DN976_c0_g1_i2:110-484(+)
MPKVKAHELRGKKKAELLSQLDKLKTELATLRVQQHTGANPAKLAKIKEIRKSIARVNTVMTQTKRHQLRMHYKNLKYKPLDLRPKKTRAIRRRLTQHQLRKQTSRMQKRSLYYPPRRYALKTT